MKLEHALSVPGCGGVDHMDFTADGRRALVSCEFAGRMIVVDLVREKVIKTIPLRAGAMPQDVKLSPDGRTFYVADMASNGVWLIDAHRLRRERFQPTGLGRARPVPEPRLQAAVRLQPRRGLDHGDLVPHPQAGREVAAPAAAAARTWAACRPTAACSGSSGRYDAEVYAISTRTGKLLHRIKVGNGPHGMARLAAARPLLDRPHRHPALILKARAAVVDPLRVRAAVALLLLRSRSR